ncbi:hypothetical protein HYH03_012927 [Edaphochlamys debaryana]|uniref:Uncharacterized protein n=1 Tax=Edaphochlamys debaryana TaxID=47281 RepID=A0A835XS06_9CHLO|nr:hypothetical protein HYH03_012927 [Edaphochlamys debaryana]|eukprot:KAG2488610.1 hypothetical protein HYH03_012927 [Edaphochlamys debaryana]
MATQTDSPVQHEEVKLMGDKPKSASPPRLIIPKPEPVGDDFLFSPGVDTPGHRLQHEKLKEGFGPSEDQHADSPKRPPVGCLSCLKPIR